MRMLSETHRSHVDVENTLSHRKYIGRLKTSLSVNLQKPIIKLTGDKNEN